MSANITLLGWEASGLRCPDHYVNLCPTRNAAPYRVSLIQMPNGTGKTTTLNMLRATLSGSASDWTAADVRSLRRGSDTNSSAKFVAKLAVNGNPFTFELNLNFDEGTVLYRTSHGKGIQAGFRPPPLIRRFLTNKFVNLFVFDGELASHLLSAKHTRAKETIDALFQLSLLDEVSEVFQDYWNAHASTVTTKQEKGLNLRKKRLEALRSRIREIKREQRDLSAKLTQLKRTVRKRQGEYDQALSKDQNIGHRLSELRNSLSEAETETTRIAGIALDEMRNPQSLTVHFASSLQRLKANLDRLKLPSSTSREFFEELASADVCVCGRNLDDDTRQAVRNRLNLYLAEDEVGVLNSMKSDIATYSSDDPSTYNSHLRIHLEELESTVRERDGIHTELKSLEEHRLSAGDAELEAKKRRLDEAISDLDKCEIRLDEIERSPDGTEDDSTSCLKALEERLAKVKKDVAEATETVSLSKKTELVTSILTTARESAREELRKLLVKETNSRIKKLLPRDPVLLGDINNSLILEGQGGASVGQTLSVSYAFLATLFQRSDYQLPFIVDSPAGALDLKVRPEVANLIPSLCQQFVAFTISSERERFVNPLHKSADGKVQYLTIFRQTAADKDLIKSVQSTKSIKTSNGFIVEGKGFFDKFDLEEEGS